MCSYTTTLRMDGILSQRYKVIKIKRLLGTCQKLAGGEGGGNRGRVTTF